MAPLVTLLTLLALLILLDLAALRWGADSRQTDGRRGDWW